MDDEREILDTESVANVSTLQRREVEASEENAANFIGDNMITETEDTDAAFEDMTENSGVPACHLEVSDESAVSRFKNYLVNYDVGIKKKGRDNFQQVSKNKKFTSYRTRLNVNVKSISEGANPLGSRRDLDKTKKAIEKDKFNKTKDDIVKKLETGLIPPGMEMEIHNIRSPVVKANASARHLSSSPQRDMDRENDHSSIGRDDLSVKTSDFQYRSVDKMSPCLSSKDMTGEKFVTKDRDDYFKLERNFSKQYTSRDGMQIRHQERRFSKEKNYPRVRRQSGSYSPDRRVPYFSPRERYPLDNHHSKERVFQKVFDPDLKHEHNFRDRRRKEDSYHRDADSRHNRDISLRRSRDTELRYSRDIKIRYSRDDDLRHRRDDELRHRKSDDLRYNPRDRFYSGSARDSWDRLSKRSSSRERYSKDNNWLKNRSISRERKLFKRDPSPPFQQYQSDIPVDYPSVTSSVPLSVPPPYQLAAETPSICSSFEQEHLPPVFDTLPPAPYVFPSMFMYSKPEAMMYTAPPSIPPPFCPPPPQIGMQQSPTSLLISTAAPVSTPPPMIPTMWPAGQQKHVTQQQKIVIQQKSNNKTITLSSTPTTGMRPTSAVPINENSRYDSQLKSVQLSMTAKEKQNINDIIKRCTTAIEKLDYLHLPNRIFYPTPKRPNTNELKFVSPMIREAVAYDFTTKSSVREKSFLVASIASTLDLYMEEIPVEPNVIATKYKSVSIQTVPFSCDTCMITNAKKINNIHCKGTMTDNSPMPVPMSMDAVPSPPQPPMSLMYLTPANILDPGYNNQTQDHIGNLNPRAFRGANNFGNRRMPFTKPNSGNPMQARTSGLLGPPPRFINEQMLKNTNLPQMQDLMDVKCQYQSYNFNNYGPSRGGMRQGYNQHQN